MNTAKHSVSVAAVITDDHGRALLVQRRDNDHWDLALSDEVAAFRWADGTEVAELSDEAYAVRVLDALGDTAPPAVRQHDGKSVI